MQELARAIIDHPNGKTLILELLNATAPRFYYETLCALSQNGKKDPEDVKRDIKKLIETYLDTLGRLNSSKDRLNEEAARSALIYLLNTFHAKNKERFPAAAIATWITLERKETSFKMFWEDIEKREEFRLDQALLSFWIYSG